jgi:hypothetical protein
LKSFHSVVGYCAFSSLIQAAEHDGHDVLHESKESEERESNKMTSKRRDDCDNALEDC